MAMSASDMISIEEAQDIILDTVRPLPTERVGILEALGRVAATDLMTDIDVNPFDDSAMDGFALIANDISSAGDNHPISLQIVGHIGAGALYDATIQHGQAVRIMTGAALPDGADTVVKIEDVTCSGTGGIGDCVTFHAPSEPARNIRFAGEDIRQGETVIRKGEVISPGSTGFLAATGNTFIPVHARPKVGIVSLGDELVDADTVPARGKKRNSNAYALAAEAMLAGASPHVYPIAPDDHDSIFSIVRQAIDECDFVVSSGGASVGDYDFIPQVVKEMGDFKFAYVSMRPGKNQTFGIISDTPFFGLAGNPAAAVIGFEMLVRPALRKMQGYMQLQRPVMRAKLATGTKKSNSRRLLLRGHIERTEDGTYLATPSKNQSSALFSPLHHANCLIVIPELAKADAGMEVDCIRIDMEEGTVV